MLILLVGTSLLTLFVSFFCSMAEAAVITVPVAIVRPLAMGGSRIGKILESFKEDISRPIAAILILNTVANIVGPTFAGVAAEALFGGHGVVAYAIIMTSTIVVVGEMVPKFLGVTYAKQVAPIVALPLAGLIACLGPLMRISKWIAARIQPEEDKPSISHEEVLSMAAIGTEEGSLDQLEGSVITNVIGLDRVLVRDLLTPRVAVFRVSEQLPMSEVAQQIESWQYTRVPVFSDNDPDHLTGYIRQRDIYRILMHGQGGVLKDIARPLETVPELMRADKLLLQMLEHREHICAVVDEHGTLAGVITMEDILEEIVGREIRDEYDDSREL